MEAVVYKETKCKHLHLTSGIPPFDFTSLHLEHSYKTLCLLRHTFSSGGFIKEKKLVYVLLVCSQLTYCSPVWRPHLLKDIVKLERIQRLATKYVHFPPQITSLVYCAYRLKLLVRAGRYPHLCSQFEVTN